MNKEANNYLQADHILYIRLWCPMTIEELSNLYSRVRYSYNYTQRFTGMVELKIHYGIFRPGTQVVWKIRH